MRKTNDTVVYYHKNCYDGFAAAYCMWLMFGDDADYVPMQYGDSFVEAQYEGKDVFMVDFSAKRQQILHMAGLATTLTVIDHHKTAEQELARIGNVGNLEVIFDMDKAGCELTWDYVSAIMHAPPPVPWFLPYIADRDLWKFELRDTKAVYVWMNLKFGDLSTATFADWYDLASQQMPPTLLAEGYTILAYEKMRIRDCLKTLVVTTALFDDLRVGVLRNVPVYFMSEVGNIVMSEMANEYRLDCVAMPMLTTTEDDLTVCKVSMRSTADHVDVAELVVRFGGGGHRNAAGFEMPVSQAITTGVL